MVRYCPLVTSLQYCNHQCLSVWWEEKENEGQGGRLRGKEDWGGGLVGERAHSWASERARTIGAAVQQNGPTLGAQTTQHAKPPTSNALFSKRGHVVVSCWNSCFSPNWISFFFPLFLGFSFFFFTFHPDSLFLVYFCCPSVRLFLKAVL